MELTVKFCLGDLEGIMEVLVPGDASIFSQINLVEASGVVKACCCELLH